MKKILLLLIIIGIVVYRFIYVANTKIVEQLPENVLKIVKENDLKDGAVAYKIEETTDEIKFYLYEYSSSSESNMKRISISIYTVVDNKNVTSKDTEVHYPTEGEAKKVYTEGKEKHKDIYISDNIVTEKNVELYVDKVISKEDLKASLRESYSKLTEITD